MATGICYTQSGNVKRYEEGTGDFSITYWVASEDKNSVIRMGKITNITATVEPDQFNPGLDYKWQCTYTYYNNDNNSYSITNNKNSSLFYSIRIDKDTYPLTGFESSMTYTYGISFDGNHYPDFYTAYVNGGFEYVKDAMSTVTPFPDESKYGSPNLAVSTYYKGKVKSFCFWKQPKKNKKFKIYIDHTADISYIGIASPYGEKYYTITPKTFIEFTLYWDYGEGTNDPYGIFQYMVINVYLYKENNKNKYPHKTTATHQYIENNGMKLRETISWDDIEDGEQINIGCYGLIKENSGKIYYSDPKFMWDPYYNMIVTSNIDVYLKGKIYYNNTLIKEGVTDLYTYGTGETDYSDNEGRFRFHFYINGALQRSQIDSKAVSFSNDVQQIRIYGYKESADDGIHADRYYIYDNGRCALYDTYKLNGKWYRKIDSTFNINVRVYTSSVGNGGDVCAQVESYNFTDIPMHTVLDMLMDDLNTSVVVAVGLNNGGTQQVNFELSRRTLNSISGMPNFKSSIYSSSGLSGRIGFYTIDNHKTTITSTHNGMKYNVNYTIY